MERDHAHASQKTKPIVHDEALMPGGASQSAVLAAPENPLTSGLLLRKAERDDNGVADGAEHAVATAATSSGAALPAAIQRKFESSLGADLSSVRVHTGGESQNAAHAVGAKAYTIGQDIHFGAGQYDPSSGAGEHLLAHEVAHTVQQQGGTPTRQNKLEVSSPGDAAEHEADRAADAMVQGASATVRGGGGLSRVIHRDASKGSDPFDLHAGQTKPAPQLIPDADDPYEQPPINFDLVGGVPPHEPQPWAARALSYAPPLPMQPAQGLPTMGPPTPAQRAKAARCVHAFETVHAGTFDIWNAIAGPINEFQNAAARADGLHLTGVTGAEFDKPGDLTQNLDQFADAQKVGPQGNKSSVAALFEGNRLSAASHKVVKDENALDPKLRDALGTAENNVQIAVAGVKTQLVTKENNASNVKTALDNLEVAISSRASQDEAFKAKALGYDKAETAALIENTSKILDGALDMILGAASEKPDQVLKGGMSAVGTAAKWINDADFDARIQKADRNVAQLQSHIAFVGTDIATDALTRAINTFKDDGPLQSARLALANAMSARKTAYDNFAATAASQAKKGGASSTEAADVEGAIKAIPIVEEVVMRIKKITSALRSPPPYSDEAGIGYRAAGTPTDFAQHYAWIKTYVLQFSSIEPKWTGRLSSLQKLASGMYSKA